MADSSVQRFCPSYKWGQTATHVVVTLEVEAHNVGYHKVDDGTVSVDGDVPGKGPFQLLLHLAHAVTPNGAEIAMRPRSVRLKLPKSEPGVTWKSLQKPEYPRPAQEKKDFDFFEDSDASDDKEGGSDSDEELERLVREEQAKGPRPLPERKKAVPGQRDPLIGPFCAPDEMDFLLLFAVLFHLYWCPFTKVEESFNMQAMHDILHHGLNLSAYDHHSFPGTVPRTFLGAMITALVASPFSFFFQSVGAPKIMSQFAVRAALGLISVAGVSSFRWQLGKKHGAAASVAYGFVTMIQFHLVFYATRALPNTFALALVNISYGYYLRGDMTRSMCLLAFTGSVFRFEVLILAAPLFFLALYRKQVPSLLRLIGSASAVGAAGVALSVTVDSLMWGRLLWPEAEVFYFNAILNRSHEWGTSPIHWYVTSALPRAMLGTALFIPTSLWFNPRVRDLFVCACVYVSIFSLLPHKELRFVLYVVPVFNMVCAEELVRLWRGRENPKYGKYWFRGATTILAFTLFGTWGFLKVSQQNYPGGAALEELHNLERLNVTRGLLTPHVHIDSSAAQQGVTRFIEEQRRWVYSKKEGEHDMAGYTHLVTDKASVEGFVPFITVTGVDLSSVMTSPRPRMVPKMRVFKRKDLDVAPPPPPPPPGKPQQATEADDDDEEL